LENCWEQNTEVHLLFIDFQAANYTIWVMEIWSEMHDLGFPKKCARVPFKKKNMKEYSKQ